MPRAYLSTLTLIFVWLDGTLFWVLKSFHWTGDSVTNKLPQDRIDTHATHASAKAGVQPAFVEASTAPEALEAAQTVEKTSDDGEVKLESGKTVEKRLLRGVLISLAGGACWGINGTFVKILLETYNIPELWLVCVRELFASVLFLVTAYCINRSGLTGILKNKKDMLNLAWISVVSILMSNISYVMTISYTNSATATVLQILSVVLVLFYVCVHNRRRPRGRELVGIMLAIGGTYLLATGGNPSELNVPVLGLVWGGICALSAAALAILPNDLLNKWGSFVVNGYAMLISGLMLAVYVQPWNYIPHIDAVGWTLIVFAIVVGTYGAYALFLQGLHEVGAVRASMLTTSEPLVAMLSSVLLMGTTFSVTDLIAFAMIIVMVYLTA